MSEHQETEQMPKVGREWPQGVDVRRADSRLRTDTDWLDSHHSFSFGQHQDADNTHHGLLLVSNDDTVLPSSGFQTHPHRDMEIVTWVLEGELEHKDSVGNTDIISGTADERRPGHPAFGDQSRQ